MKHRTGRRANAMRCIAIIAGDTAYGSWRDLALLDVKDRTQPRLISHRNWAAVRRGTHAPPAAGIAICWWCWMKRCSTTGGEKLMAVDIRSQPTPVSIATFRRRMKRITWRKGRISVRTTCMRTGRELCQLNADLPRIRMPACGLTIFPRIARWRPGAGPAAPERMMDTVPAARVIQSCDVFVDAQGIIYSTDYNGGLSGLSIWGEGKVNAKLYSHVCRVAAFTRPTKECKIKPLCGYL